jgi:hypothetical protein
MFYEISELFCYNLLSVVIPNVVAPYFQFLNNIPLHSNDALFFEKNG